MPFCESISLKWIVKNGTSLAFFAPVKQVQTVHKLAYNVERVDADLELRDMLVNVSELVSEVSKNLSLPVDGLNAILSSKLNFTEVRACLRVKYKIRQLGAGLELPKTV